MYNFDPDGIDISLYESLKAIEESFSMSELGKKRESFQTKSPNRN